MYTEWDRKQDARVLAKANVEVWTPVVQSPDRYWVSNMGRVLSFAQGTDRMLKGTLMPSGRTTVGITTEAGSSTQLLYRLEVEAFDGPPPSAEHTDTRHLDGDETNNRLDNLLWGTRQENMQDVLRHRRVAVAERIKREHPTNEWYQGYTFDNQLIEAGLALYHKGKLTTVDLAAMWRCTYDVASNIVRGHTRSDVIRPEGFSTVSHRSGEMHHASVMTDVDLAEGLRLYTNNHWSAKQFADHMEIDESTASQVLYGKTHQTVPRPAGFQYPWPDAKYMNTPKGEDHGGAKLKEAKINEVFSRIISGELQDMKAVQLALGVSRGIAYGLVGGREWAHLSRPEGFTEAVAKMQRTILSKEEQEAVLAELVAGASHAEVQAKYNLSDSKIAAYVGKAKKVLGTDQKKLSKAQREEIRSCIAQGLEREELNAKLGLSLDRSAFYKYKKSLN